MSQLLQGFKGVTDLSFHSKSLATYPHPRKIQSNPEPDPSKTAHLHWTQVLHAFAIISVPLHHFPPSMNILLTGRDNKPVFFVGTAGVQAAAACKLSMSQLLCIFWRNVGC